jgi:hypothetical protein
MVSIAALPKRPVQPFVELHGTTAVARRVLCGLIVHVGRQLSEVAFDAHRRARRVAARFERGEGVSVDATAPYASTELRDGC